MGGSQSSSSWEPSLKPQESSLSYGKICAEVKGVLDLPRDRFLGWGQEEFLLT